MHNIGLALDNYMSVFGSRAKFPSCAEWPTTPVKAPAKPLPSLATTLAPYIESNTAVFYCPGDDPIYLDTANAQQVPPIAPQGLSYFQAQGLSYEWPMSTLNGFTRQQVMEKAGKSTSSNPALKSSASATIMILWDYDAFHGPLGDDGSRDFLYLDGHADSS